MGSRRCCSCETRIPERCEGCCAHCIAAHKIEYKPGVDTFANQSINDILMLHQSGKALNNDQVCTPTEIGESRVKIEYVNIGSFWTWYHPAYMVNFDISLPPCTNMVENARLSTNGYPNILPIPEEILGYYKIYKNMGLDYQNQNTLDDALTSNGYYNLHAINEGLRTDFPRFNKIFANDPYECRNTVDCPGDYFGCAASMNVYQNNAPLSTKNWNGGPVQFRFGYPCSTDSEDRCCAYGGWWNSGTGSGSGSLNGFEVDLFNPYSETPWGKPRNAILSCNFLGLSKYQRRLIRTYFPWAWQINSYALDHLIPFGNSFHEWALYFNEKEDREIKEIVEYGAFMPIKNGSPEDIFEPTGFGYYPMSHSSKLYWGSGPGIITEESPVPCKGNNTYAFSQQRASSLRQQFLGFAFCEHHYDPYCGLQEIDGDISSNHVLITNTPKRFVFACSGIPMFEFDLWEAYKENIITSSEISDMINSWKSFTMWHENPKTTVSATTFLERETPSFSYGSVENKNTPNQNQVETGQFILNQLSERKYSGIIVKDWRSEAYDEIIEANIIYRDCIADTYILRNYTDSSKTPQQIKTDAEEYAKQVFDLGNLLGFGSIDHLKDNKNVMLPVIFPSQLGPIRKRCRQNNPAKRTEGTAEWSYTQNVTRKSPFGLNVLTPYNIFKNNGNQRVISVGTINNYNAFGNLLVDDSDSATGIDTAWKYQSLYYADISKPLFKEDEYMPNVSEDVQPPEDSVGSENGKWSSQIYGDRYSEFDVHCDMVNRISHLCYTYFFAQPAGWDFIVRGPLPNYRPEWNWWNRRYGFVETRFEDLVTYLGAVRKHSSITGCGQYQLGNFEYSWNPRTRILKPPCDP